MYALILAGGPGSRMGLGEKPMITIFGTPMIRFVIDAFEAADCEVIVILSPKTPYTHAWCRAQGISHYTADGRGYIEDFVEAARVLDPKGSFFTSVADLPCLEVDLVQTILSLYQKSKKDALSTWVPRNLAEECGSRIPYVERVEGVEACPVGINILRGDKMEGPQDEVKILLDDPRLAYNINTRKALARVNVVMKSRKQW